MCNISTVGLSGVSSRDDFAHDALGPDYASPSSPASETWSATQAATLSIEGKSPRPKGVLLQNATQFGPGCRPMFYTALLNQPQWLGWCPIANVDLCSVLLEDSETGAAIWSATTTENHGFQWQLPELNLARDRIYQWSVQPSNTIEPVAGPIEACSDAFPTPSVTDRKARFWLISIKEQARFVAGLAMLRERADPAFLVIAEALFLAEFQMYHHALTRLPAGRNRGNMALSALCSTTRSVIFRQMAQRLKRTSNAACFLEWAELNEEYHRKQTEARLCDVEHQINKHVHEGTVPGSSTKRANSTAKLRHTVFK